ncbi:MAG: hypothetical protein WC477_03330 [Patescibacteria group bacterium]
MPNFFSRVIGHAAAKQVLTQAVSHPRHGYMITGVSGVGCHTLAEAFVRALTNHPEPAPLLSHPDIILLEREMSESGKGLRKEISVKAVRELRMRMSERPMKAARCVAYISDGDALNEEGANALLKSVEEPLAGAVFVFVAHDPSRMPKTLRSRLVTIHLERVGDEEIEKWLQDICPTPHAPRPTPSLSDGRPGIALQYLTDESFRERMDRAKEVVDRLCSATSVGEAFDAIADTASACDNAEDAVAEWRNAIHYWQAMLRVRFADVPSRAYDLARIFLIAERRIGGPVSPRLWIELGFAHVFDGKSLPNPFFVPSRFPYEIEVRS